MDILHERDINLANASSTILTLFANKVNNFILYFFFTVLVYFYKIRLKNINT